ncbi:hypothetical protein V502_02521, partial [Pseudogymnoascus sp. VKM F-4520 (FW-2644)]
HEKALPDSDPRNMEDAKHFAEVIARSIPGRVEDAPTVQTIRNRMPTFMPQFQRETNLKKKSVTP